MRPRVGRYGDFGVGGLSPRSVERLCGKRSRDDSVRPIAFGRTGVAERRTNDKMAIRCGTWASPRAGDGSMAEPQVCSTEVMPTRAPRCLGSAAMVIRVSAEALNSKS